MNDNPKYITGIYLNKIEKKEINSSICDICKNCKEQHICKHRKNKKEMHNCYKCKSCTNAVNCDKFYFIEQHKAILTIGKDPITGNIIRKTFSGKTIQEAIDKLYDYRLNVKKNIQPQTLEKSEKTIAMIILEVENHKYRLGKTNANSYNTNLATLERIKLHKFSDKPISKVTRVQIEEFLNFEKSKSNSTLKKDYIMLKCAFDTATYHNYIHHNFFTGPNKIELPKSLKEDKDILSLTFSEQKLLENYLLTHESIYKNIILLCLYSGIRIGECLALNYTDNINMTDKILKIRSTLTKDLNKKTILGPVKTINSKRNIEINELTENILIDALNHKIDNKFNILFICPTTNELYSNNSINSGFKRICRNAGIIQPVNVHMLRHTFATRCIEAGVDLAVLQKLMGHANIETTIDTYGDIYNYYKQKETQKMIDYLTK